LNAKLDRIEIRRI